MKKSFKMFLAVLMCSIFGIFTITSVSAQLSNKHKNELNQLYIQYVAAKDSKEGPDCMFAWRKEVWDYFKNICNGNLTDQVLSQQAFLYLASKITGNKFLEHLEVWNFNITCSSIRDKIQSLKCYIVTTSSREWTIQI